MKISESLAGVELEDADGKPVRLAELWREQAVVLVFLRHFG